MGGKKGKSPPLCAGFLEPEGGGVSIPPSSRRSISSLSRRGGKKEDAKARRNRSSSPSEGRGEGERGEKGNSEAVAIGGSSFPRWKRKGKKEIRPKSPMQFLKALELSVEQRKKEKKGGRGGLAEGFPPVSSMAGSIVLVGAFRGEKKEEGGGGRQGELALIAANAGSRSPSAKGKEEGARRPEPAFPPLGGEEEGRRETNAFFLPSKPPSRESHCSLFFLHRRSSERGGRKKGKAARAVLSSLMGVAPRPLPLSISRTGRGRKGKSANRSSITFGTAGIHAVRHSRERGGGGGGKKGEKEEGRLITTSRSIGADRAICPTP